MNERRMVPVGESLDCFFEQDFEFVSTAWTLHLLKIPGARSGLTDGEQIAVGALDKGYVAGSHGVLLESTLEEIARKSLSQSCATYA
jgi:hypothetical protein